MGAVTGMLGLAGGVAGTGIQGPQSANIQTPVTTQQADEAYKQQQAALAQQQAFAQAVQAQNGIGNQSSVFNQLQGVANGTGPNPAQAQLANATGANVANQAALMAGQRGSSANAGLLARQAAQQGAGIQQNAAGQAASMQANQSLNALNQLGGIAGQQVAQQQAANQAYGNQALQGQSNILGGVQAQNQANVSNQASINAANAGLASGMLGNQAAGIGGLAKGAGVAAGLKLAEGGSVPSFADFLHSRLSAPTATPSVAMAKGGAVPAMVSPGEQYLPPQAVEQVKKGASPLSVGERIPGTPKYKGNNYANDVVPKTLEAGGIVVPNKVMQSKDRDAKARAFVEAVLAKKGKK